MDVINDNYLCAYGNMRQEKSEIRNQSRGYIDGYKCLEEKPQENINAQITDSAGISAWEAYESMSGKAKIIPEASQDTSVDSQTESKKVIDVGVVTLSDMGISFYFNEQTGEVRCVNLKDPNPGRQVLWSKQLSGEEMTKCDALFESYPDYARGCFEYRYKAYLMDEEFWDMFLDGKIDLKALDREN